MEKALDQTDAATQMQDVQEAPEEQEMPPVVTAEEFPPTDATSAALVLGNVTKLCSQAGGCLSSLRFSIADLDGLVATDPTIAASHPRMFNAASKAAVLCQELETKHGKLAQAVDDISAVLNMAFEARRHEVERIAGLARSLECTACYMKSFAVDVVGAYGDPVRAPLESCPECGMMGLKWADAAEGAEDTDAP